MIHFCYNEFMTANTYDIAVAKGAEVFSMTYADAELAGIYQFDSSDWGTSISDGVVSATAAVAPALDDSRKSIAGYWLASVSIPPGQKVSSAHPRWDGTGNFTVSYTLTGNTWHTLYNGQPINLANVTDPDLDFKVEFAGGIEDDDSKLSRLTVYLLEEESLKSFDEIRNATFKNMSLSESMGTQSSPRTDEGSVLKNGYFNILSDDGPDPINRKSIEFWARLDSDTGVLLSTSGSSKVSLSSNVLTIASSRVLINGVVRTNGYQVPSGWNFWRVELGTASNVQITLGAELNGTSNLNMAFFGVAIYTSIPEGTYEANVKTPTVTINESDTISVTQADDSVDIYSYSWSITSTSR
jgi:hypothetical protein